LIFSVDLSSVALSGGQANSGSVSFKNGFVQKWAMQNLSIFLPRVRPLRFYLCAMCVDAEGVREQPSLSF